MIVLGIDTALDACSAAIVADGEVLAHISERMSRGQAERLAPMAREAALQARMNFSQLQRIAVTTGPGSFTGVRVGLSFARTLALALGCPCIGVSTLEALALGESDEGLRGAVIETPGAAYLALYECGAPLLPPQGVERGEARAVLAAAAAGRVATVVSPGSVVDVASLARRAGRLDPACYAPQPSYLRAPHVTLPGGRSD